MLNPHRVEDGHGREIAMLLGMEDVSTRARIEDSLRESEDRFRMIADNISQLAWTCDRLGNVTWYNQRWLEYTGLSFEAMQGWDWSKVQHPDHLERVVASVQSSAESGEPWEDTFPLRGKDGIYRWFLSRAVPIRDAGGKIECERRSLCPTLRKTDELLRPFLHDLSAVTLHLITP